MELNKLAEEFPRESVSFRVQGTPYERNGSFSAMALAYIDARDVADRLDEVCGPAGWQDKYEVLPSGLYVSHIGVHTENGWVWKADGAGETQVEGKKGGLSDAFKRCGVKWGIGRYLYRLDSPWVKCEVNQRNGKTYWKKWTEDPWSKVKATSYLAAEQAQQSAAFETSVVGAVLAIEKEPDMNSLSAFYGDLYTNQRNIATEPRVVKAKDKRKAELAPKEEAA